MKKLIFFFLRLFAGKDYANKLFNPYILLKYFFFQKVLRINARVPWPVHFTSQVKGVKNISKGSRNPGMSMGVYIDGRNGIEFGENVWIGPKVSIISMNHSTTDYHEYIKTKPINIGDDCWIGAHAIILPGISLEKGTVVAAGSVVTKSFNEKKILIGGNPAKKIKNL